MLLPGVLFVLFLAGCWLYCLTDAALTPAYEFRGWPKPVWMAIIAVTFIVGATAWVIARRAWRSRYWPPAAIGYVAADGTIAWHPYGSAQSAYRAAVARHPATRSGTASRPGGNMPKGPDDDPEFLAELAQRIHGNPKDPSE
jgi:hypothetical protein